MAGQRSSTLFDVDSAEFVAGLTRAIQNMHVASRAGLIKVGDKVVNSAKQKCPVDTGRLRSALHAHQGEDEVGPYIDVGVTLDDLRAAAVISATAKAGKRKRKQIPNKVVGTNYGWYVEYGTSKMAPQPFLRPALAEVSGYLGPTVAGEMGAVNRGG